MNTEEIKKLYTAVVTTRGGRQGHVLSADGILNMDLVAPKEMGGSGAQGTNPEQLFAGAFAGCFESALRLAASLRKKPLRDASITAHVTLNAAEKNNFFLSVELHGKLDGISKDEALELMRAAHEICPYSKATRGNVEVKLFAD
ncbi:MAG: organic hydroperoxide resistance protein [Candidatus Omnitrophota bacterium]